MEPQRRDIPDTHAQVRVATVGGKRKIIGYGAVFNRPSGVLSERGRQFVERIEPHAFDDCLRRCDVRGLYNHSADKVLGRTKSGTMRLSTDAVGLRYEIDAPDTEAGRDVVTLIERGDIDGSSFSFTVDQDGDSWDRSKEPSVRTIHRVRDLFDLGPVTFPAYPDATADVRTRPRSGRRTEQEIYAKIGNAFERGLISAATVVEMRHRWREMEREKQRRLAKIRRGERIFA